MCTVEPGGSAAFLAPRSLPWLTAVGEVPADQVELFRRLGLRSLGEQTGSPELLNELVETKSRLDQVLE